MHCHSIVNYHILVQLFKSQHCVFENYQCIVFAEVVIILQSFFQSGLNRGFKKYGDFALVLELNNIDDLVDEEIV